MEIDTILLARNALHPFQIVDHFDKYRYIVFTMYLDIVYIFIYVHNKNHVSRKAIYIRPRYVPGHRDD